MPAVVEAEHVARTGGVAAISQGPLRTVGNGLQARYQPVQWPLLPISGKQRPHDRAGAKFARRWNNPRIAHPKRRPKPLWRRAACASDGVMTQTQFDTHLRRIQPQKI